MKTAIFAAGCFWGVEHYFKKLPGVIKTEVGYTGGSIDNPSYQQVCAGNTGHVEAIRVDYDETIVDYETLVKYFFEIHDPTQKDGQGPDLGEQYLSKVFYHSSQQADIAKALIQQLQAKGYAVQTEVVTESPFWPAEDYHQDYYQKTGKTPYCHRYTKRFDV